MNQDDSSSLVIYESKDGAIQLYVKLENETVWLSANQMASLFDRDEKTIRKHVNNVFNENELAKENNTQKMRVDGVKQPVAFLYDEDGQKRIADHTLVALTIMIAESRTEEKEMMVSIIMNCI